MKALDNMGVERLLPLGLLAWYPFEKGKNAYVYGDESGSFADDLNRRGLSVGNSEDGIYDYVIVLDSIEFDSAPVVTLKRLSGYLKSEGHLFLAVHNRMGLRYFCGDSDPHTGMAFDGVDGYQSYYKKDIDNMGRCYDRHEWEDMLAQAGFTRYRGYSILPGLEMPQQICSWDYLPMENMGIRYTNLYHNPDSVFLNEKPLYDEIIKNGMFHQMANAYMIDVCQDGSFYEVDYVTLSMDRGEDYATATIIQKDEKVIKKALYSRGNERIRALTNNTDELSKLGISTVAMKLVHIGECDGEALEGVQMDYINAPTVTDYLRGLVYKDRELFISETCRYFDMVLSTGDKKYDSPDGLGAIYSKVFIDLVPLNCFFVNGEYVAFDQEYMRNEYPINMVLARSLNIIYMGNRHMEGIVPMSYFKERYGLERKWDVYIKMEGEFLNGLRNRASLSAFNKAHQPNFEIINGNRQKINYSLQKYMDIFVHFMDGIENRKVYVFGSGNWARRFLAQYGDRVEISGLIDNNIGKWEMQVDGVPVCSPQDMSGDFKVIICVKQYASIVRQLADMGITDYGIYDPDLDVESLLGNVHGIRNSRPLVEESIGESDNSKPYHIGYVAGVFDLFHIGHLNLLRRAKEQCEYLIVGVVSDEQASKGKTHSPYVREQERLEIVRSCRYVDEAFVISVVAMGTKDIYKKYHFDVQFSGSDYENAPGWLENQAWLRERGSDIVFFPYTQSTSSTKLKAMIEKKLL